MRNQVVEKKRQNQSRYYIDMLALDQENIGLSILLINVLSVYDLNKKSEPEMF